MKYPYLRVVRGGVTLVEVLVVLAILAVLLGLLLPAIQRVRASADRLRCAHHLRQLALGIHLYETSQGHYPAGKTDTRNPRDFTWASWRLHILPYVGEENRWEQAKEDYEQHGPPFNQEFMQTAQMKHRGFAAPVRILGCAADWRVSVPWRLAVDPPPNYIRMALTSYLGNSGTESLRNDGVLYVNSRIQSAQITDGLSNTLLLGERPPTPDLTFGMWYLGYTFGVFGGTGRLGSHIAVREYGSFWPPESVMKIAPLPTPPSTGPASCGDGPFDYGRSHGGFEDVCAGFTYWSPHPGGNNFAFCDGSVRPLTYGIGLQLQALASRQGGEVNPELE